MDSANLMTKDEFAELLRASNTGLINTLDNMTFNSTRDNRTVFTGVLPGGATSIIMTSREIENYKKQTNGQVGVYNIGKLYKDPSYAPFYEDYLDTPYEDSEAMNRIRFLHGIDQSDQQRKSLYGMRAGAYNRYKIPFLNDQLGKSFSHVFFTRPNCNLFDENGKVVENVIKDPFFFQQYAKNKKLFYQLSNNPQAYDYGHDFGLLFSNCKSFQLSDEYIGTNTYGTTVNGHKVSYGQSDIESQTAETFNIEYTDDGNLNIYFLHKLWVKYISNVYTGRFSPRQESIFNKELDYASSCYYFLCGEDGETIKFWSKYYGVFPITIPSSQFSYQYGQILALPSLDIKYQYSWKRDTDPLSLLEFNMNAFSGDTRNAEWSAVYTPSFDVQTGHAGPTWVGPPYVELCRNNNLGIYDYKLRFRSFPDLYHGVGEAT